MLTRNGSFLKILILRRFLRARRFDPDKAQKQFAQTEAWRTEIKIDELYATFPAEEFEAAKNYYPNWTGRRDKVGTWLLHPVSL